MRYSRSTIAILHALAFVGAANGAMASSSRLDIPAQRLDQALRRLARDADVEVLFDPGQVSGLRSRAVKGDLPLDQALLQMLGQTSLSAKRTTTGGYVLIEAPRPRGQEPLRRVPVEVEQATVAEILVSSRRAQNADIRRSVDDIQPYSVLGATGILDAQADDVEDLLRQHLSSNTVMRSFSQAPVASFGSNRSQVNIGGFGAAQTLVLIDGRRMPATPEFQNFGQPDLNGLPSIAIDRIETLSSTAGGIYGNGATGGVVNIVLKRNYSGGEFESGGGITQHGDAAQWRAAVVLGGSWFDDRLHLFASVARQHERGLRFGDRSFVQRSLAARYANGSLELPVSNAWNLYGFVVDGDDGAIVSTSPLSLSPRSLAGIANLKSNAGRLDLALSEDGQGRLQSLLTTSTATSIIFSGRVEFSDRFQMFADLLALQNTGTATGPRLDTSGGVLVRLPDRSTFPEKVRINFPTPGWSAPYINRSRTTRATLGAIARLGRTWSAEFDVTLGAAQIRTTQPTTGELDNILGSIGLDVFQDYQAFATALAPYADLPSNTTTSTDRFFDVSVRSGGSISKGWAGPITLTALVEARRDRIPSVAVAEIKNNLVPELPDEWGNPGTEPIVSPPEDQTVYSAYAELRAPLTSRDATPWLLRGLEAQLAVRSDHYVYRIPVNVVFPVANVTSRDTTTSTTFGLKAWPLDGLMLRGSYATGFVAPSLADMTPRRELQVGVSKLDPRRPGEKVGGGALYVDFNGSPRVRPERVRALAAGLVISSSNGALRASLDYTHLNKSREVVHAFDGNIDYVLAHEAEDPGAVLRAALTDADRAKGLTAGVVKIVDTAAGNLGRSAVDSFQVSLDYRATTSMGVFEAFAEASWMARFRRQTDPEQAAFDVRRALDGPLPARGAFGGRWSRNGWTVGVTAQAYGGSRVSYADPDLDYTVSQYALFNVQANGGDKVPPQIYFDGDLSYRAPNSGRRELVYRLGVRNLLDHKPPLVTTPILPTQYYSHPPLSDPGLGYSTLGDPRGRRFVASIQIRF